MHRLLLYLTNEPRNATVIAMLGSMALPLYILGAQNPRKEVVAMTCQLILNWKSFAALGGAVLAVILGRNLTPDQSERVLTAMVNAMTLVDVSNDED